MSEILQKRIEEAAEAIVTDYNFTQYLNDGTKDVYTESAVLFMLEQMAKYILSDQWISVEEALPEEVQEGFCDDKFVLYCGEYPATASYDHKRKKWYYGDHEILAVTHWMNIPNLEGGEK